MKGYEGAMQFYAALLRWGRHGGLPPSLTETPAEYGLRLKLRFPAVGKEIELIIAGFNREVYGELALDEQQVAVARLAWRKLRSPLQWPSRLKSWIFHPAG